MTTTILASFPSPSRGVWHLGIFPLRAYAFFILAGVIAALLIGDRRWAARGGERGVIFDIALWAVIFGLIGGRLYHVLTDWTTYFGPGGAGLGAAFAIWDGGLGIWGAVALGGVGAWIGCRRRGIPLPPFGDAIAPGIVLAQAIGRLGNYFNQELYGRPTTMPWGLEIYERRDATGALDNLNGVSTGQLLEVVHPTFLYELLWNVVVFAVLIWVDRRYRVGHGRLFALYVALYCFGRFWVELMRSDTATLIAGIRINSFVSVFVFIGAVVYIMVAPKGREDPASLRGNAVEADATTPVDELAKELAGVAATSGVVAAATVAGAREDAEPEADDAAAEPDIEAVSEAEQLTEDVAEAPAEDIAEAEAFAGAGEQAEPEAEDAEPAADDAEPAADDAEPAADDAEADDAEAEPDIEAVSEAEQLTEDVAEAPAEDIAEAEAFAEAGEQAEAVDEAALVADGISDAPEEPEGAEPDAPVDEAEVQGEPVGGVGAVEGDEVVEAEESAAEVHQAAVEGAEGAAELAGEVAAEEPHEAAGAEDSEEAEPADESEDQGEPVGGVGAVEGDEEVEAEEAADVAAEVAAEEAEEPAESEEAAAESTAEEPEESDGAAPVEQADADADAADEVDAEGDDKSENGAEPADQAAVEDVEEHAAAEEAADELGEQIPSEEAPAQSPAPTTESGSGSVRRWLRSRLNR